MISPAIVAPPAAIVARATIAHHSKSFALASRLLDARTRDQTAVVYAWCRRADDAIDEVASPAEVGRAASPQAMRRLIDEVASPAEVGRAASPQAMRRLIDEGNVVEPLAMLRRELDEIYAGTASDPVLAAFSNVVAARAIPRRYPDELLAGMEMDVVGTHYATMGDLRLYCWRVASVVGLMMSHVFGVADDAALVPAAQLGIAMQLTNICRDVAEDWGRNRLYVPADLLARVGAPPLELGQPLPAAAHPALALARRELLGVAERYYRAADRGIPLLPWRAALAVRAARDIYRAIGSRIARADHQLSAGRAFVSTGGKLALALGAAARVAWTTPLRLARASLGRTARVPTRTLELSDVPEPH